MWYTNLVLATLERSDDLTIVFLMANNPFSLVFTCFLRLFLPSFELWEKEEEDPKLSAPIPVLLSPQVKNHFAVLMSKHARILYRVGRPIIRKVSKVRIWVVPPVCLGSS